MEKRIYEAPAVEVVEFETEEIMALSGISKTTGDDWGTWGSTSDF